jgi:hypothetical protein
VVLAGTYASHRFLIAPLVAQRDALRIAENAAAARAAGLQQEAELLRQRAGTLTTEVRFAEQALALLRQPGLVVADLAATDARPEASGRMFWHPESRRCYLHAGALEPPAEGHSLVLWLFTADRSALLAGRLEPDVTGEAALLFELPGDANDIVRALVSDEETVGDTPAGGELLVWSAGSS